MTKYVSLNNGHSWLDAEEAMQEVSERPYLWKVLVDFMDDEIREAVHRDLAPCRNVEFLTEYLKRANDDLVIG